MCYVIHLEYDLKNYSFHVTYLIPFRSFVYTAMQHYSSRSWLAFSISVTDMNDNCCAHICCFVTQEASKASGNSIPVTFESFSTAKLGSNVEPWHLKKLMLNIRPKQCLNSSN